MDARGVEPPLMLRGEAKRCARLGLGRCGGGEAAVPRGDGGRCAIGGSSVKLTALGLVPTGAEAGRLSHRRGVSSVLALGRRPLASAFADSTAAGPSYFLAISVRASRSACCLSKRSDCRTRSGCDLAASRGLGEGARGRGEAARLGVRDIGLAEPIHAKDFGPSPVPRTGEEEARAPARSQKPSNWRIVSLGR